MNNTFNPFEALDFKRFQTECLDMFNDFLKPNNSGLSEHTHFQVIQILTEQIPSFYKTLSIMAELVQSMNVEHLNKKQKIIIIEDITSRLKHEVESSFNSPISLWQKINDSFYSVQPIQQFLNLPSIGFNREQSEKIKQGERLWNDYLTELKHYESKLFQISSNAIDLLKQDFILRLENNDSINSLREVYDLWIDVNEKEYKDYVLTDEHSKAYGKLINSSMHMKKFMDQNVDHMLQMMNLPTQNAMQSVLQREKSLEDEVAKLQQEIESIKRLLGENSYKEKTVPPLKKKSSVKKKVSKRKTTRKKVNTKKQAKKKTK